VTKLNAATKILVSSFALIVSWMANKWALLFYIDEWIRPLVHDFLVAKYLTPMDQFTFGFRYELPTYLVGFICMSLICFKLKPNLTARFVVTCAIIFPTVCVTIVPCAMALIRA